MVLARNPLKHKFSRPFPTRSSLATLRAKISGAASEKTIRELAHAGLCRVWQLAVQNEKSLEGRKLSATARSAIPGILAEYGVDADEFAAARLLLTEECDELPHPHCNGWQACELMPLPAAVVKQNYETVVHRWLHQFCLSHALEVEDLFVQVPLLPGVRQMRLLQWHGNGPCPAPFAEFAEFVRMCGSLAAAMGVMKISTANGPRTKLEHALRTQGLSLDYIYRLADLVPD